MIQVGARPVGAGVAAGSRARFGARPVRNILLAAASLAVIAGIVVFLAGPPGAAAVSFRLTSYRVADRTIVVFGKVTQGSRHTVPGARVQVYLLNRDRMRVLADARTSRRGLYRVVLRHLRRAVLHVRISTWVHDTHYRGAIQFRARVGNAYGVFARLLRRGSLFFLPVSSY